MLWHDLKNQRMLSVPASLPNLTLMAVVCAGNAVVNVYINKEKNFSFVEFRTGECVPT